MSKEMIVRLNEDRVKINGCEYVQDLIRCKDCAYGKIREIDGKPQVYCDWHFDWWYLEGFCSYAEPKEVD